MNRKARRLQKFGWPNTRYLKAGPTKPTKILKLTIPARLSADDLKGWAQREAL
jgi:hypothetical protein